MGSFFQTLKSYLGVKMGQVQEGVVETMVRYDTDSAIAAEVQRLEAELDKATNDYVQARRAYDLEQREAEQATAAYNRMLAAAEDLEGQRRAAEEGNNPEAATIRTSVETILGKLEEMRPEVEREAEEAKQAKAYMEQLSQYLDTLKKELQGYRGEVEKAKREMKSAEVEAKLAQQREEQARKLAGLQQRSSNLKVVLEGINKQTEAAKASAEVAKIKTELVAPQRKEDEDPLIAAALERASGAAKPVDLAGRLEALKKGLVN
jgi:chromosome segregation ATPase